MEGHGYETWQSSLLHVSVGYFGYFDPAQNLVKYKMWSCVLIQLTSKIIAIM